MFGRNKKKRYEKIKASFGKNPLEQWTISAAWNVWNKSKSMQMSHQVKMTDILMTLLGMIWKWIPSS